MQFNNCKNSTIEKWISNFLLLLAVLVSTFHLEKLIYFVNIIFRSSISEQVNVNDRILFVTFLGLIWYAWETKEMKDTMKDQLKFKRLPRLDIYYEKSKEEKKGKVFKLKNNGEGAAYNIKIEDILFDNKKFGFNFNDANLVLVSNNKRELYIDNWYENREGGQSSQIDSKQFILDSMRKKVMEAFENSNGSCKPVQIPTFEIVIYFENSLGEKFKKTDKIKYKDVISNESFEIIPGMILGAE